MQQMQKRKERTEKTTPFGVSLTRSQILYCPAQGQQMHTAADKQHISWQTEGRPVPNRQGSEHMWGVANVLDQ